MSNTPPIWILIDGTRHAWRQVHHCQKPGYSYSDVIKNSVPILVGRFNPDRVIAAYSTERTFRRAIDKRYQSLLITPPSLADLIAEGKDAFIEEMVDVVESSTFESKDIVATITGIARQRGRRVIIASRLPEYHQLLRHGEVLQLTRMQRQANGTVDAGYFNAADLNVNHQIRPDQWVDFRCLTGDPDNGIAGIAGFGTEAAGRFLHDCGKLESFYHRPGRWSLHSSQQTKLIAAHPRIANLRRLHRLRDDAPLPKGWN